MAASAKKVKEVKKIKEEALTPAEDCSTIYLPDRDAKIAEIAYLKAASRGFSSGHELEDWLEAEQEFSLL